MALATLYLQDTLRHSPLQSAAMLMPVSLAVVAGVTEPVRQMITGVAEIHPSRRHSAF